jgi:hypothetical protein
VRHSQIGPFFERQRQQLKGPQSGPHQFQNPLLPIVPTHDSAREVVQLQEFAHLVGIPRRQKNLMPFFLELFDDGEKEGNMWRVVEIDPDFFRACTRRRFRPFKAIFLPRLRLGQA